MVYKNFHDWVKQIEKYCKLTGLPEARKRLIAYQTSKGAVSGFINRYMEAFPQSTWAELKTELENKFLMLLTADMHLVCLDPLGKNLGKTFNYMLNVY